MKTLLIVLTLTGQPYRYEITSAEDCFNQQLYAQEMDMEHEIRCRKWEGWEV